MFCNIGSTWHSPLSAKLTTVSVLWILCLVVPEVNFEIAGTFEFLLADGTLELLGVRVDQHVPVYQVALSVVLATKFAPVERTKCKNE